MKNRHGNVLAYSVNNKYSKNNKSSKNSDYEKGDTVRLHLVSTVCCFSCCCYYYSCCLPFSWRFRI